MVDYIERLRADLAEQFKDKPVIDALNEAIGEQLNDLRRFFEDLKGKRGLYTAQGKQLDGIGDIVVLDRTQAGELACIKESVHVLDDDEYRKYLIYKIWKNANNCTYEDILRSFRMFWDNPMYYSEFPEHPATMFFYTDQLSSSDDVRKLLTAPYVKAAGVGINITIRVRTEPLIASVGTAVVCVTGRVRPAIATRNRGTRSDMTSVGSVTTGIVAAKGMGRPAIATRNASASTQGAITAPVSTKAVSVGWKSSATAT